MNILEVKNLSVSYGNNIVLDNISFQVKKGEYICLVGENGTGKSTLLKTIVKLKEKTSGDIKLNTELDKISYIPQVNTNGDTFPATVKEIILTGFQKNKGKLFYSKDDYKKLEELADMLGITTILNNKIGSISGGQKQRVMIARSLCKDPEALFLDEPFSGLDVNITKELYKLIKELNEKFNITILMATHDLKQIKNEAKRIIVLDKKVVYDGSAEEWRND